MHVLRLECGAEEKDRLIAELWERGSRGIEEQESGGEWRLLAFFEERIDFPGTWEQVEERDWVEVAQAQWEPVEVGRRFYLVPPWRGDPAPEGRLRLEMRPGRACGSGAHPGTQLALEGLERVVRPGAAVLDVGTGSGILAEAAKLLGAGAVYGCDIDGDAVAVAREAGTAVELFVGSAEAVQSGSIDVVVVNIGAEAVAELAGEIRRVLRTGGRVVASGFREEGAARVRDALGGGEVLARAGWAAVVTE